MLLNICKTSAHKQLSNIFCVNLIVLWNCITHHPKKCFKNNFVLSKNKRVNINISNCCLCIKYLVNLLGTSDKVQCLAVSSILNYTLFIANSVNRKYLRAFNLVGPPRSNPEPVPLAVTHLDNWLYIDRVPNFLPIT